MHLRSFTGPPENMLAYRPWRLNRGGEWQTVDAEARVHHGGFVGRLADVSDRFAAAALTGTEIAVERTVLPAPEADEYYWRDLTGLNVYNLRGESLGRVARLLPTPAHDVLVIDDGGRERLIPFVRSVVAEVDVAAGCVVVDWQPDWH